MSRKFSVIIPSLILSLTALQAHADYNTGRTNSEYSSGRTEAQDYKNLSAISGPAAGPRFELSFDPILLKAGASNLNYAIYNKALPLQSPSWYEQELKPDYSFAFELAGRYMFAEGTDVSLDWTHLNSSISSSTAAASTQDFIGPDFEIGPDATVIRSASGRAEFRYDVINLNSGQTKDFGRYVKIRMFGGLSDGLLREKVSTTYFGQSTAPFAGPFSMQQQVKSDFSGIGPRFGLDAMFTSDWGIGVFGEASASALIGSIYSKTSYIGNAPQLLAVFNETNNAQTIMDQHVTQVVPGFDAKVGVNYKHELYKGSMFMIGAGYQAAVYVNAISQYLPGSLVSGDPTSTGGIFVATMAHTISNYSVQGPFMNFTVQF
jgi:hypothetical protein